MKWIARLIIWPLFLLPLLLVALLFSVVDDRPTLQKRADLTPERIARGKKVFEQNDPRRLRSGAMTRVALVQDDLDLAINYLANQYVGSVAGLSLDQGQATIVTTLALPPNPLGRFVNLSLALQQGDSLPTIDHALLGKVKIPGFLAEQAFVYGVTAAQPLADWRTVAELVKRVEFQPGRMTVTYRWQDDLPAKLSGVLLPAADQARIEAYQRRLAELTQGGRSSLPLAELTRPLFALAQQRSRNGEAVAENRALILALAFYANHRDLNKLVSASQTWPRPNWRTVKLSGRDDFPKHYLISAMLAAYSGTPLSDAVGLFKEIDDSRGGSGFSFNDMAADRAGTRMAERAVAGEGAARKIQVLMMAADENDFMPATADLPEFMPEPEFVRRFGGTQGAAYQAMMQDIERRIAALPVLRD